MYSLLISLHATHFQVREQPEKAALFTPKQELSVGQDQGPSAGLSLTERYC